MHRNKRGYPRIGLLYLGAPHSNPNFDVFVQGLRELGDIEGKNILIEYRYAEGKEDRLPELATELVRLKVDAIFTAGTPADPFALKQATKTIPIVFFSTSDPIGTGIVASLAPGWQHHRHVWPSLRLMAQAARAAKGNLSQALKGCHALE